MKQFNHPIIILLILLFNFSLIAGDANFSTVSRAKTLSLNGLYFAGNDGFQCVLGNPSMLSFLNSNGLEVYVTDNTGRQEFENQEGDVYKSFSNNDFSLGGGLYWTFSESFAAALSYQRAFDFNVDWPYAKFFSNDSTSSLLAFDFFNKITIDAASVSFAFKFDQLSVGASVNYYYVEEHTKFPRSNERWDQGLGLAGYEFGYNQDGHSFGFNVGASLQLNDQLRFGMMTRSSFKTDLSGTAVSNMFAQIDSTASTVDLSGTFEMPWVVGGGLVYDWTDNLTVNFDLEYNLWSGIQKSFDLSFDNSIWRQNLSAVDSLTGINATSFNLSFENSLDAGVGIEYKTSNLHLRTGYRFSQSPITDEAYTMLFPTVDKHWISLGIGYRDENLLIDLTVAYAFGVSREVSNASIKNLSGRYKSSSVLPAITIKYLL